MSRALRPFAAVGTGLLIAGVLGISPVSAAPGVGTGGVDVVPGTKGGATVVVEGTYTEVPSGSGIQAADPGVSSSGGSAPAEPSGSQLRYLPTEDPAITRVVNESGDVVSYNAEDEDGSTWECGLANAGECVQLSPDVGVPPTPVSMAEVMNVVSTAVSAMQLEPPPMCSTPKRSDRGPFTGLVGRYAWYWLCPEQVREQNVGPVTRTVTSGAVTVNMTAVNTGVAINPGDGSIPLFCPGALLPFTPYTDLVDASPATPASGMPSPTCGRHMEKTSITEPGGTFSVSATSMWVVNWTAVYPGGGVGGVIPTPLTTTFEQRVGELQVLVTPNIGGIAANGIGAAIP